jgi:hypothetical protein
VLAPRELLELQRDFAAGLLSRDASHVSRFISGAPTFAAERFSVYANNFRISLTDALEAVHPATARLLGGDCFRQSARRYIETHPSPSGDLHDFGADFGTFLESIAEFSPWPFLGDVARLEWRWHRAFHAPDRAGEFRIAALAAIADEELARLRLVIHPSAALLRSRWPVLRIWEENRDPGREPEVVSLDAGGVELLITRAGLDVDVLPLRPGEYELIDFLLRDAPLETALEAALQAWASFEPGTTLARLAHNGTLLSWRIEDPSHLQ